MDVDVMVWSMLQNLLPTQTKEKEEEERGHVRWKDIDINIWTLTYSIFGFSFISQNLSFLMWKFLFVSVFQRQQEVKKYKRRVEGGHLSKKKRANLSIEHPLKSKRIPGCNWMA